MNKETWRYGGVMLVALAALAAGGVASASGQAAQPNPPGPAAPSDQAVKQPLYSDDFDQLPAGLKAVSMSTLVSSGKVHAVVRPTQPAGVFKGLAPLLTIVWGAAHQTTTTASGEPATGMHPTNPLMAIVSGNFTIDNTTDGGLTWTSRLPPNPHNSGDVVNAWLEGGPGPAGANALELSINGAPYDYTCGRSTDFGVTWATDAACGPSVSTPYFDDREYIWVDRNPASPFYGRVYVTTALFDAGGTGSFNTMSNRWSSDNGASWNPPSGVPLALVPNNEFALGLNHNEYPSLGISPNGTLGYAWHRGACCGGFSPINAPNKVMFARSTDGGVSFPFSNTIVTVPLNQTIPFNSTSPLGVRWSDTPNIAADPATNGTFYAVWTQYRTPSTAASAAIYLSKTTDNGATWSTPVIPYNNPNANIFQGFGWVKVTTDHAVHVSFVSGTTSNTTVAQFYVQSTDGGATFSAPFQLSASTFGPFSVTTDYEAMDVSGLNGGPGVILAGWAQANHWARMGTFVQGTPTPTVTSTSTATRTPTATSTSTTTRTPTVTSTSTATSTVTPTSVATATPCPITFSDVHPTDYFYVPVQYLACHGVISGYADGTFRPYNQTTRSQMVKIVVLGFNKPIATPTGGGYTFTDVPPTNPFFSVIETAASLNIVSGYACGSPGEPCDGQNRPYFRPFANVTRGQLSKIDVVAAGWTVINPATQSFQDVFPNTAFYTFVETAYCHGIISGYSCGGPGEPCGTSGKPYFRQFNDATRGQIAKIVYGSITSTQACVSP